MDKRTIDYYNKNAREYAQLSLKRPPERLYDIAKAFLKMNGVTYDIGCGGGRDTAYFKGLGFNIIGIDASEGLLKEAAETYKQTDLKFIQSEMPRLLGIAPDSAENIFSSGVLHHIDSKNLLPALTRLVEILKAEGTLILSWRNSQDDSDREGERLYSHFSGDQVMLLLESLGCNILFYSYEFSDSTRPELPWYILVVRKKSEAHTGLFKIQSYIVNDDKTSTYKLALLRAIARIAQSQPGIAGFRRDSNFGSHEQVFVTLPMDKIAEQWLYFYWGLYEKNRNEEVKQGSNPTLAVYNKLQHYDVQLEGFIFDKVQSEDRAKLLSSIATIIENNPVQYLGRGTSGFSVDRKMLVIPASIWRDMVVFGHWIEQSLVVEWAYLSERFNKGRRDAGYYFNILINDPVKERDARIRREIIGSLGAELLDTWTGEKIENKKDAVIDHILPFSAIYTDHLWNLTPTKQQINSKKSDFIPRPEVIQKSSRNILNCWEVYLKKFEDRFSSEIFEGLRVEKNDVLTEHAINALIERASHLVNIRGYDWWDFSN